MFSSYPGRDKVIDRFRLQALVYDILPPFWKKVPETDARSVAWSVMSTRTFFLKALTAWVERRAEIRIKWSVSVVTNSGRVWIMGAGKRGLECGPVWPGGRALGW